MHVWAAKISGEGCAPGLPVHPLSIDDTFIGYVSLICPGSSQMSAVVSALRTGLWPFNIGFFTGFYFRESNKEQQGT